MIYDDQTSSAMNYYEELGVSQEATEQEIRKAHRRLVKLMHPDAQPDQSMKMLAETQMRRLNSIVSTLLDPDQRRSYDEQLYAAHHPLRPTANPLSFRGMPWWLASVGFAVVLTLAAVWVWADHMSPSYGRKSTSTVIVPPPDIAIPATSNPNAGNPDRSQPLGASYQPPVITPPPDRTVSDPPKNSDPHPAEKEKDKTSAAVVDPPAPPAKVTPPVVAKQADATPKVPPPPAVKPQQKSQSVVVVSNPPAPAVNKVQPLPAKAPQAETKKQPLPNSKDVQDVKILEAKNVVPTKPAATPPPKAADPPPSKPSPGKKTFTMPPGTLVARVSPSGKNGGSQVPTPPRVSTQSNRDYNSSSIPLPSAVLPAAAPPPSNAVTGASSNQRDPLEGEWVYAPKEPERRRAGFYPPEYIDLKLFGAGDPGNLKGQYSARYVVTDRPVSPEVSFELASAGKGSRKFVWQSTNGARGTMNIDTIDDRTIQVDWHTTSAVHGPALTSGTAILVRRQ